MTVSADSTSKKQFTSVGLAGPYTFDKKLFAITDLEVYTTNNVTGVVTQKFYPGDFTFTGFYDTDKLAYETGIDITFTSPITAGHIITINRNLPLSQGASFPLGDKFPPRVVEKAIDYLTLICQQIVEKLSRVPVFPLTSVVTDLTITPQANQLLGFNSAATGFQNFSTSVLTGLTLPSFIGKKDYFPVVNSTEDSFDLVTGPSLRAKMFSLLGNTLKFPRVNAGETDLEFRTGVQMRTDLGISINPTRGVRSSTGSAFDGAGDIWGDLPCTTKTAAFNLAVTDRGAYFPCNLTAGFTISTILPASSFGNGFYFYVHNTGSGPITFDPNSTETVNGVSTEIISPGQVALFICDGANWNCQLSLPDRVNSFFFPDPQSSVSRYLSLPYTATNAPAAAASTINNLYAMPFRVDKPTTYTRIGINVAVAGGNNARLGIYAAGTDTSPGSLILDAGTVSTSTTGSKEITINQTLMPGLYYLAIIADGNPSYMGPGSNYFMLPFNGYGTGLTSPCRGWFRSTTYGVLPNPFGSATELLAGVNQYLLWMRP